MRITSLIRPLTAPLGRWVKQAALNNALFPDSFYTAYFNLLLRWRGVGARVTTAHRKADASLPRFRFTDLESGTHKYFCYRKQGLSCFGRGLKARGHQIATTYSIDLVPIADGDVVIDCGSNTGDLAIYFEGKGIAPRYIAVEPGLEEFQALQHNLRFDQSEALNLALGEQEGHAEFFYKPEFGDSSLVQMEGYEERREVEVKRLDTLVPERLGDDTRIKLLKLEAEGFEPEICRGLEGVLDRIDYIAADLGFERGIQAESTLTEVCNFLLCRGFEARSLRSSSLRMLFARKDDAQVSRHTP